MRHSNINRRKSERESRRKLSMRLQLIKRLRQIPTVNWSCGCVRGIAIKNYFCFAALIASLLLSINYFVVFSHRLNPPRHASRNHLTRISLNLAHRLRFPRKHQWCDDVDVKTDLDSRTRTGGSSSSLPSSSRSSLEISTHLRFSVLCFFFGSSTSCLIVDSNGNRRGANGPILPGALFLRLYRPPEIKTSSCTEKYHTTSDGPRNSFALNALRVVSFTSVPFRFFERESEGTN